MNPEQDTRITPNERMKYGEENILRAETYKDSRISVTLDSD